MDLPMLRGAMIFTIRSFVVLALAYPNGANDNFKGMATLFGSGTANCRGSAIRGQAL
jgi:inorganic phosphate transporter, PiT family